MRDLFAGATKYQNQPTKEIAFDLYEMIKYSKKLVEDNKKALRELKTQADLRWIFQEIILFAEKLIENSKKEFRKVKKKRPLIYYCKELIKMGNDAHDLNLEIGTTWHGYNNYGAIYKDNSAESRYYRELRDYIVSMMDLNNIGHEIKNRYFENEKPLFKERSYWGYIRDISEIIINAISNIFKQPN